MWQVLSITWWPVLLVFNATFNNVSYSVEHGDQFYWLYLTLLKVSLSTNKTGNHVVRYNWHIVESVVKHKMSGIT
jgi:hypothetical protein